MVSIQDSRNRISKKTKNSRICGEYHVIKWGNRIIESRLTPPPPHFMCIILFSLPPFLHPSLPLPPSLPFSLPPSLPPSLTLSLSPADRDYTDTTLELDFSGDIMKRCFSIDVTDDDILETEETFAVVLTTENTDIALLPQMALVVIEDDDSE